jgi:ABC-type lipoprotein export system ATPase subunit
MVTHDPRYAAYAERTVRLFDGKIVEDLRAARAEVAAHHPPVTQADAPN